MTAGSVLREIHRLRRNAKDLKSRIDQGPRQQQTQKDKVARQEEILRTAQDELKHLKVENHQKEVSLKALDEKVDGLCRSVEELRQIVCAQSMPAGTSR